MFGNYFYLWNTHLPYWEVVNVLLPYAISDGMGNERLPETLLERILDERKLPIEKSLWAIAYIYDEYVLEKRRQTETKKNT